MPLKVFRRQQITARIRKKSHKSHACVLACSLSKQWLNIYIWKGQKLQDTPKTFTKNHRNSHLQWSYTVHGIPCFFISEGKKTGFFFMEYSNPSTDNNFNWRDFSAFCFKTTVRKLSEEKKKKKNQQPQKSEKPVGGNTAAGCTEANIAVPLAAGQNSIVMNVPVIPKCILQLYSQHCARRADEATSHTSRLTAGLLHCKREGGWLETSHPWATGRPMQEPALCALSANPGALMPSEENELGNNKSSLKSRQFSNKH